MRLTCPNCDAQYEVDARAIPPEGRDVQCSSCGHLWFEPGAEALPDEASDEADDMSAVATPDPGPAPTVADSPSEAPAAPADAPVADAIAGAAPEAPPEPAPEPAPRRELDASVTALLREEAEREARARRAERAGLETQADLGLDRPVEPARVTPRRATLPPVEEPVHRSAMLPDIDATDATLRGDVAPMPPPSAEGDAPAPAPKRSGGFMRGFALVLVLGALLFAAYVQAPALRAQVPAAGPTLDVYVATVDGLRRRLDALVRDLRQSSGGAGNS